MKKIIFLFIILIIIAIAGTFVQNYLKNKTVPFAKTPKATINNQSFNLLLAKTGDETQKGLSEKDSLDEKSGMLFIFNKADYYPFWMRKMKFPIDIIYIKDNKIVTVYENVQLPATSKENLPVYRPENPADKVLEINAGLSRKYGFKNGYEVKFENL